MSGENPRYASQGARAQRRNCCAGGSLAKPERRHHPRLIPHDLWTTVALPAALTVIEWRGDKLALRSEAPLRPGQHLTLEAGPERRRAAEVTACRLEESDPALLEMRYRIDCRLLAAEA